jgi:probable F420-dependent oxidoreductase
MGVFTPELRLAESGAAAAAAAELEALGFGAVWCPGGPDGGDVVAAMRRVLAATDHLIAAPAVVNVHVSPPHELAVAVAEIERAYPGRVLLGLGVSHAEYVEARGESYAGPVERLGRFLDALDAAPDPVPVDQRFVGAQSPRMIELARTRTAGVFPYMFTAERTAGIRELLGPDGRLIVEVPVVLDTDPTAARDAGRRYVARYTNRRNYLRAIERQGFGPDELAGGGSDRLVDAFVAWGDLDAIGRRVAEYFDAGADHVSLQLFNETMTQPPIDGWRRLAELL